MEVRADGTSFGITADNIWKSSVTMNEDVVFESEEPAFRKDQSLRADEEAFLLGGDLMVVTRWAEDTAKPNGEWNKIVLEDTPDDGFQANLFQRPGSIIPVADLSQNTTEYNTDNLTLLVNLDSDGKSIRTYL